MQKFLRSAALVAAGVVMAGGAAALPDSAHASPGQSVASLAGGTLTATQLAQSLVGSGVTISNVSYTGDPHAAGQFSGLDAIGIPSGVALSSGAVATEDDFESSIVGPNDQDGVTGAFGTPGDPDLTALIAPDTTNDAAVLEFDFVPTTSQLSFDYVFGSDEYNEYVGSFNDVFGFFVNGQNCATIGDPPQPVSVNDINQAVNPSLYRDNDPSDPGQPSIDTQMDGITTVLTCAAAVQPGQTNHLKLAIADANDTALDSDVFIGAGSIQANNPPTANDDSYSTGAGSTLTVPAPGVLGNDTDPENDTLTADTASVTGPAHGTLSVAADGSFTYTPTSGYTGTDSFTYQASDGAADSQPATVSITVGAVSGPTVNAGPNVTGPVNTAIGLDGSSTGTTSTTWSVPTGTPCTIADPAAVDTTITCTAAGTYTATLTGTDGTTTVSDTTQVKVTDVTPPPGRMCHGQPVTIMGTPGDDTIVGTRGDDVIFSGKGADVIDGRGGSDIVCAGAGNDTVRTRSDGDLFVKGGGGNDLVRGGVGDDVVVGGVGDDVVRGGPADDRLRGGPGDDRLIGDGGTNVLDGNGGTDACGSSADGTNTYQSCESTF